MPRKQKLKVFRTPIGFHDAYVAAPSQKAALEAWGSDRDLFARGIAERVEEPELVKAPLAQPGVVLRRLRGSVEEQFAALPADPPSRNRTASKTSGHKTKNASSAPGRAKPKPRPRPKPKPDRAALKAAERALARVEASHRSAEADLERRQTALARERAALEKKQASEQARLARRVEAERAKYERAMAAWQDRT